MLVDVGLASVLFVAPLFMGGRYDIGRLAYVVAVCFAAICWAVRQCVISDARWRWSGAEVILAAGLLLILLQLTPLPQWLLLTLSPEIGELLPLWTSNAEPGTHLGTWSQLTMTPQATRGGLVTFLAHAMLFLVVVQRIRNFADIERLMRWLAMAAIGMALLGLAQFLFSNGKFLWFYEHPSRDTFRVVKGTFQNQNHFAHFLALGIGPLIWWLQRQWTRDGRAKPAFGTGASKPARTELSRHGLCIGLGLVAFAGLLTFSRGGVIAMFTVGVVCVGLFVWKGMLGKKSMIAIAGLSALMLGALAIHGYEPLAKKLATLRDSQSLEELSHGRKMLWGADLTAIPKFALAGTGAGSHRQVYRTYLDEHFNVDFTHAESGYIHILLENGFLGLILMLCAVGLVFYWCIRTLVAGQKGGEKSRVKSRESRAGGRPARENGNRPAEHSTTAEVSGNQAFACAAALLAGLVASMIHSFGDFVWYIPACMSLTIITAACICRLYQMSATSRDAQRTQSHMTTGPTRTQAAKLATFAVLSKVQGVTAVLCRPFTRNVEVRLARSTWIFATAAFVGAVVAMLSNRIPPALAALHWDAYFKIARTARTEGLGDEDGGHEQTGAMITHLEDLLARDPYNSRANLQLAGLYLRAFDVRQKTTANPMPLSQIRDAALASQFPSAAAQDEWLDRILADNRPYLDKARFHAKRGLKLCPLQGEGYVYLAELAFLDSSASRPKRAYVGQAVRVRPHEGAVLLAAGGEAALAGDAARALELWKRAFHQAPEQQMQIIELLGPQMAADEFVRQFQPDLACAGRLYSFYRKNNQIEQAQYAAANYVQMLESEARRQAAAEAAIQWDRARSVYDFLGDHQKALDCARSAVAQAPADFGRHRTLASALMSAGLYDEALRELQWCLSRKPGDQSLEGMLQTCSRERVLAKGTTLR